MNLTTMLIFIYSGNDGLSALANQIRAWPIYIGLAYILVIINKAIREQVGHVVNKLKTAYNLHLRLNNQLKIELL